MSTFSERFKLALKASGHTRYVLSQLTGINQVTLSNYYKGINKKTPKPEKVALLAYCLNVDEEWLLTGKGEIPEFISRASDEGEEYLIKNNTELNVDLMKDLNNMREIKAFYKNLLQNDIEKIKLQIIDINEKLDQLLNKKK